MLSVAAIRLYCGCRLGGLVRNGCSFADICLLNLRPGCPIRHFVRWNSLKVNTYRTIRTRRYGKRIVAVIRHTGCTGCYGITACTTDYAITINRRSRNRHICCSALRSRRYSTMTDIAARCRYRERLRRYATFQCRFDCIGTGTGHTQTSGLCIVILTNCQSGYQTDINYLLAYRSG